MLSTTPPCLLEGVRFCCFTGFVVVVYPLLPACWGESVSVALRGLLLLSTHSSLLVGGSPFLLLYGVCCCCLPTPPCLLGGVRFCCFTGFVVVVYPLLHACWGESVSVALRGLLLLSTHSSLLVGGSPFLLLYEVCCCCLPTPPCLLEGVRFCCFTGFVVVVYPLLPACWGESVSVALRGLLLLSTHSSLLVGGSLFLLLYGVCCCCLPTLPCLLGGVRFSCFMGFVVVVYPLLPACWGESVSVALWGLLLLSTYFFLLVGGSPFLLLYGVSPPASPTSHLAGLLRRRDASTNPGPTAWCVSGTCVVCS